MVPTPAQARPKRLKGHQRREQLLDAAVDLVDSEGVASLTMERVAIRADVSKPVLYSHFDNRGDLVLALLERYWADLDRRVATRLKESTDVEDHLVAVIEGYFDAIAEAGPVFHQLLADASHEPMVEEARAARYRKAEAEWSRVYQDKWGIPAPVADITAAMLRGSLESAAGYWLRTDGASRNLCVHACLAVFRGALSEVQETHQDWS